MDRQHETFTDEELRAFVGDRADVYLAKWAPESESFANGAAFLLGPVWIGYRKLYKIGAILVGLLLVEMVLEEWLFLHLLGREEVPPPFSLAVSLGIGLVCGFWGDRWYRAKAEKTILEVRALGLPEDEKARVLAHRGGTNPLGVLYVPFLGFATVFVVITILEFLGFALV